MMTCDFTLYLDDGQMLLRPENTIARNHLEKNEAEYGKWLVWFYFGDGSSILLPKEDTNAFFVRPGRDIGTLSEVLVKRGFIVAKDNPASPPSARVVVGNDHSPWLLYFRNYMIPKRIVKMMLQGSYPGLLLYNSAHTRARERARKQAASLPARFPSARLALAKDHIV